MAELYRAEKKLLTGINVCETGQHDDYFQIEHNGLDFAIPNSNSYTFFSSYVEFFARGDLASSGYRLQHNKNHFTIKIKFGIQ